MDDADEQAASKAGSPGARERRQQRLKAALRDNLLKRKAQIRARMRATDDAASSTADSRIEPPALQAPVDVTLGDADSSERRR